MPFKPGTIKHLEKYIAEKIRERGFEDETLHERLLLLTEELGELVKACRKISGMNIDQNREIMHHAGEEVADMLNLLFSVGIKLDLDIEKEFLQKEIIVDKREYRRANKLS